MTWRKDINSNLSTALSINPAAARTTSTNGTGVDLSGYHGAMAQIFVGAVTDGTHTPKLQESDDNSTFTDVAAADLSGSFTALTSSSTAGTSQEVGYIGRSRYVRVVMTVTGSPSTGGLYAAAVVRGNARSVATT